VRHHLSSLSSAQPFPKLEEEAAERMEEEDDDRPVSPPHSTDAPIDLSRKVALLLPGTPPRSPSPAIEVSLLDNADSNHNLVQSALDLRMAS
jgi:hypothetical protein